VTTATLRVREEIIESGTERARDAMSLSREAKIRDGAEAEVVTRRKVLSAIERTATMTDVRLTTTVRGTGLTIVLTTGITMKETSKRLVKTRAGPNS
jgi:hypothetical protein